MLTRLSAAIVGLLAFAGCIIVGLLARNPFETTILRALGGLGGGMLLGSAVGWLAQRLVEDNFRDMVSADIAEEMRQAKARQSGSADGETAAGPDARAEKSPGGDDRRGADATDATATATNDADEILALRAAREIMGEVPMPPEPAGVGAGADADTGETAVHG